MKRTSTITQCAAVLGCHFKAFPAINQMLSYTLHPPFPNPNSTSPPSTSINHLHPPELHNRVIITTLSSHLAQKHSLITPSAPINSPATSARERLLYFQGSTVRISLLVWRSQCLYLPWQHFHWIYHKKLYVLFSATYFYVSEIYIYSF